MFTHENCRLRMMAEGDLAQVLAWRNSERVRKMMYTEHLILDDEHRTWFARARERDDSRHLVFEFSGRPLGVVNITRIDLSNRRCHWGFYLGEVDRPKGCGTAMGALALELMFDELRLHKVIGEAFAFNADSIKYHLRLGFVEEGRLREQILKNGRYEDIVTLAHFADQWQVIKPSLMAIFAQGASV